MTMLALLPAAPTQAAVRLKPPILVRVAHDAKLGPLLVKANGRTLYHFSRDQNVQRDLPETALMKTLTWLRNHAQRQA